MIASKILAKTLVVNSDGQALVLRRSASDEDNPGRVDFPGGGVDAGEAYAATAARELEEEAGLHVAETDLRLVYAFTKYESEKDKIIMRLLYVTRVKNTDVKLSHEHDAYWWYPIESLREVFSDTSWAPAIDFVLEHDLLA